jgi:phenylpropionate dioxygenase-like ring-hydroxylating dioxygenase large terminal subunit
MTRVSLEQHWHPIARVGEIDGQPRQFILLGVRLVAFRDDSGPVVFKDLCIHRGAELSRGHIEAGLLTCPYHGWRYDRGGACVHIPALPEGATIPAKARAIAYRVREEYGLVWVAMAEPVRPFPEWPENAWTNPDYHVFLVGDYTWATSAGRAVENAMDFSHFNFVHKGYTELADGPVIKKHEVAHTDHGIAYAYDDGARLREYTLHFPFVLHDKKTVTPAALAARGKGSEGGTWSESGDSKPGDATILTFIASPIDAGRTRLFCFIARNHSLDRTDEQMSEGFDEIMEQDRRVVESQHPEEIPAHIREELHLRVPDAASIAYRKLLLGVERSALANVIAAAD